MDDDTPLAAALYDNAFDSVKFLLMHGCNLIKFFPENDEYIEKIISVAKLADDYALNYDPVLNNVDYFSDLNYFNETMWDVFIERIRFFWIRDGISSKSYEIFQNPASFFQYLEKPAINKLENFYKQYLSSIKLFELNLMYELENITMISLVKILEFDDFKYAPDQIKAGNKSVIKTLKFYRKLYKDDSQAVKIFSKLFNEHKLDELSVKYLTKLSDDYIGKYLNSLSLEILEKAMFDSPNLAEYFESNMKKMMFPQAIKVRIKKVIEQYKIDITNPIVIMMQQENEELLVKLKNQESEIEKYKKNSESSNYNSVNITLPNGNLKDHILTEENFVKVSGDNDTIDM
jgi:hypothetical protein